MLPIKMHVGKIRSITPVISGDMVINEMIHPMIYKYEIYIRVTSVLVGY